MILRTYGAYITILSTRKNVRQNIVSRYHSSSSTISFARVIPVSHISRIDSRSKCNDIVANLSRGLRRQFGCGDTSLEKYETDSEGGASRV